MNQTRTKRKKLRKKLFNTYRLVILNENTFEEKFSFKLNRLNIFVLGIFFIVSLIAGTTVLIAFTPLREYIPGYSSTALKLKATELTYKTDSINNVLRYNNQYLDEIRKVLSGEIKGVNINKDSLFERFKSDTFGIAISPNGEDTLLREQVAREDKYNLFESSSAKVNFVLFPPISGSVTQKYNPKEKHFAVDITAPQNTPVKAVADGTVIFSGWTAETGYTIIIEHPYDLTSVYKHNASNTKSQGDFIKSGEIIATIGNTGEITTGPHLHFELWSGGYPVNPAYYIDFE